jgi:integrase
MGEDPEKPGYVKVRQLKTDAQLSIRIHRGLRAAIDACPSGKDTFLVSQRGTPYTKESLGNWFKEQCVEAGLPHCSAHGLRKAAARRMAELGLSNQLIKSITGHTTDSEVSRYTKNADQARRADKAMTEIEGFGAPGLAHLAESGENAR